MNIDFKVKDVIHNITVKFVSAFLPTAKKQFNLRAVNQPELDIHGIASKAHVYNITTRPKVIEEGLTAGIELMYYLAADGYKIKTPLFNLGIGIPGEYDGSETSLPEGVFPVARLKTSTTFRKYLREHIRLVFDGLHDNSGLIAKATDEATGLVDELMTRGHILTISGYGLKIESEETQKDIVGVFFKPTTGTPVKAPVVVVNNPRTLKVLIPSGLKKGTAYQVIIETMSSLQGSGTMLKKVRNLCSEFTLTAA
jgi:hypothetical protein